MSIEIGESPEIEKRLLTKWDKEMNIFYRAACTDQGVTDIARQINIDPSNLQRVLQGPIKSGIQLEFRFQDARYVLRVVKVTTSYTVTIGYGR